MIVDEYEQNQLVVLVDQVEAKTQEANLSRAKAYNLVLSGMDHRTHGNRTWLLVLRKVESWIEEATILDVEIAKHFSQVMILNNRIQVAEVQAIIRARWEYLHSVFHACAYAMDPEFMDHEHWQSE